MIKEYTIYIGVSSYHRERCSLTVGITTNLKNRMVLKSFTPHHIFTERMTRADAQSIEGYVHTILDHHFDRSFVDNGWYDRKGERPNRTKDWWYCKPIKQGLGRAITALGEGYNKRFHNQLKLDF